VAPDLVIRLMAMVQPVYKQVLTELGRTRRASNAKATRVLGVHFRTAKESLIASAKSLI
jgi:hypothetical protein